MGTATWKWEDERTVSVSLGTDAYDLADYRLDIFTHKVGENWICIHNRSGDLECAERKVRWLFEQAGMPCPPIVVE